MDLFELLKNDHQEVEKLLDQLKESSSRAAKKRESGIQKLHQLLIPHMEAEEEIFYPALLEAGEKEVAYEGFEEHKTAKLVLQDLESMKPDDERFGPYTKVLTELILHHVEEEETEMFDRSREQFSDEELEDLAQRVQARKRQSLQ